MVETYMAAYKFSDKVYGILPTNWAAIEGMLRATKAMHEARIVIPQRLIIDKDKTTQDEFYSAFDDTYQEFPTKGRIWPFSGNKTMAEIAYNAPYNRAFESAREALIDGMRGNIKFVMRYNTQNGFPSESLAIDHFLDEVRLLWYPGGRRENLSEIEEKIKGITSLRSPKNPLLHPLGQARN